MKHVFKHLFVALLLCGPVHAQEASKTPPSSKLDEYMEMGSEVSGIRVPYYDEEGTLKALLYGGQAKVLEGGVAEVTNIRIDVFEKGAVIMTVFAPQCFTRVIEKGEAKILSVESDGVVLIEMEQMTITGCGFRFTSESNRFEILDDAKVLVKESAQNMKGLEL